MIDHEQVLETLFFRGYFGAKTWEEVVAASNAAINDEIRRSGGDLSNREIRGILDEHIGPEVRAFQEAAGIPATGRVDVQTELYLEMPRCGVPDMISEEARNCQWPRGHVVRYGHAMRLTGLTTTDIDEVFELAVLSWSAVSGVRFQRVVEKRQANVWATSGPIDGRNRTLAFAYFPCGSTASSQFTQKYDTAENWSNKRFLQEVIAHETGHSLGIAHLKSGNLMQPYATGRIVVPQAGDAAEAVSRYGDAPAGPPKVDPAPPPVVLWPSLRDMLTRMQG